MRHLRNLHMFPVFCKAVEDGLQCSLGWTRLGQERRYRDNDQNDQNNQLNTAQPGSTDKSVGLCNICNSTTIEVSDIRALIQRTKRNLRLITLECFSSLVAISFEIPSLASQDASTKCICFSKKLRAHYKNTAPPSPSSSSSLAEIRIMIDNSTQ